MPKKSGETHTDLQETTHFGYRKVATDEKVDHVARVFHSVANKYDLMNDLMSLGSHRLMKRLTVELSAVRRGQSILDLAGGTGDLAALFSPRVGDDGQVILCDINRSMLDLGRDKLLDKGLAANVEYVQADAERLPFPSDHFDCITIGFGLRNFTHKDKALASMLEVLKPGGRLLVLEFSSPRFQGLQKAYDVYSRLWPRIGKWITGDPDSYQYLVESIRVHPDQEDLKSMMQDAGYSNCSYHNLMGGIAAIHKGFKS
jgi:demethylmenaquinone methyltransferase/2-methoxy-6-polyprenyl-1,4-benzoquinol methylase